MQGVMMLLCVTATAVSPIEKVLQLLGDLEAKIVKDGEAQQKIYEEFTDFCSDTSKELEFAIKTGKSDSERFAAAVADSSAQIQELSSKIEDLAASTSTNQADLKAATEIRDKEHQDFLAADKDMAESISMLRRAIAIIEKEMSKGSSLLQTDSDSMNRVAIALQSVVAAAGVNTADKAKIQALLQADDFQPAGAPAAAAYENQSGGIVETLEDMLEKAEAQASEGQKAEMTAAHNFAMLKQGLEDAMKNADKEMADAKHGKGAAEEAKAEAEGELERTNTGIADNQKSLKDLQHECMTTAEAHEQEMHERSEELGALAAATKILEEKTGAAADRTYSFAQVKAKLRTRAQLRLYAAGDKVVALLQQLSRQEKQTVLAQLAQKVRSSLATESDPFAKVKGMIQEMVEKLVKEAADEAGHKAYCDKEMGDTKAKMDDKQSEVDDLNTDKDKFEAKIAKLTEAIATLEQELADIAAAQKQADEMRAEEKAAWATAKSDFEQGLGGVQMALQVLRDYYAKKDDAAPALVQGSDMRAQMALVQSTAAKSDGAASGIIGMLEVAESDFSKMLSEGQSSEDQLQKEYDTVSEDNRITSAKKDTEAKYSAKDKKETEALLADTKDDMGVSQEELSAIMDYWAKLQPQCVAKPEPYEERKKRRENEIAGLKEALSILEAESSPAFLAVRTA